MGPVRAFNSPGHSPNAGSTLIGSDFSFTDSEGGQLSPDSTTISCRSPSSPMPKRKHSEKRREGWRISVQKRRSAQSDAFHDLRQALALPDSSDSSLPGGLKGLNQVDLLRVAVAFVKLRSVLDFMRTRTSQQCKQEESPLTSVPKFFGENVEALLPEGGFLIIMSTNGDIMYVSGNVAKYFGCENPAIFGTSLYDYVEKTDVSELNKLLAVREMQEIVPIGADAFKAPSNTARLQLRSGHSFQVTGKVFLKTNLGSPSRTKNQGPGSFFVGVAEPVSLPNPYNSQQLLPQVRVLGSLDWVCSADMKTMMHCEPKAFLGYTEEDFTLAEANGMTPFDMYFPEDLARLQDDFRRLFTQGQAEFSPLRILAKNGGWAWFISHASTMVVKTQGSDGSVQAVTHLAGRDYMISEVMEPEKVVAAIQIGYKTEPEVGDDSNTSFLAENWDGVDLELDLGLDSDELLELIGEIDQVYGDDDSNSNTTSSLDELCSSLGPEVESFKNVHSFGLEGFNFNLQLQNLCYSKQ